MLRRAAQRSAQAASRLAGSMATAASSTPNTRATSSTRSLHTTASRRNATLNTTATSFIRSHDKLAADVATDTPFFIDNAFQQSAATTFVEVHDPATNHVVTRVPQMTRDELEAAVASAAAAFPAWRSTSIMARQQIMFKFVALIRENWDRLAASITLEQGKTLADARGDVLRGLQVAEAACAAPELLKGEVLEVAKDMETRSYREPLGVTAAICPFSKFFFFFVSFTFLLLSLIKIIPRHGYR